MSIGVSAENEGEESSFYTLTGKGDVVKSMKELKLGDFVKVEGYINEVKNEESGEVNIYHNLWSVSLIKAKEKNLEEEDSVEEAE